MNERSKKQRRRKSSPKHFPIVHRNAAGIDLGSRSHFVAVPEDRCQESVREFGCYTPELHRMARWLRDCGVETVAMESTGVYWVPVLELLEDYGFEVLLVDARQVKSLSGKKTDVVDCQWIQRLHCYGLLKGAFRPQAEITSMRAYWRQRSGLVKECARHIQLMQKALEQMNVQLHKAVSDISGKTGMNIIRSIVKGERDPKVLALHRDRRLKASYDELVQALTGNYREEHVFALTQAVQGYDFFQQQMENCDRQLESYMQRLPTKKPSQAPSPTRRGTRRKNQPYFDLRSEVVRIAGFDASLIPGIDALSAQELICECDIDMKSFPSAKNFASWTTLCPNNRKTGGRIRSRNTRSGANRAATVFRRAAQSLHRSQTALGAFHRRQRARHSGPEAVTATAHKLARMYYRLAKYGDEYVEQGQRAYEEQYKRQSISALKRRARHMGFQLLQPETGEVL